jgi:hypothetical protein
VRWLWLHRTDLACSWVSLLLNKDATTVAFFNASIRMMLGNGESLFFWTDPWLQGTCLADIALDLTAAVGAHQRKQRSVANALHNNNWTCDITDALTISVLLQYLDMWHRLQQVQLLLGTADSFSWRWEPSGVYSCSSYRALCNGHTSILGARELWKVCVPSKCIFFMWLVVLGRCWTSKRCHRHNFCNSPDCALYPRHPKFIDHLLVSCTFACEVWFITLSRCS